MVHDAQFITDNALCHRCMIFLASSLACDMQDFILNLVIIYGIPDIMLNSTSETNLNLVGVCHPLHWIEGI